MVGINQGGDFLRRLQIVSYFQTLFSKLEYFFVRLEHHLPKVHSIAVGHSGDAIGIFPGCQELPQWDLNGGIFSYFREGSESFSGSKIKVEDEAGPVGLDYITD